MIEFNQIIKIPYCEKELASFKSCLISARNLTSAAFEDPFWKKNKG